MRNLILTILIIVSFYNVSVSQYYRYEEGYYIDTLGNKIEGYIKLDPFYLKFRSESKSKEIRVKPNDIILIELNGKKYKTIKNFYVKSNNVLFPTLIDTGIAEEVIEGKINVYEFMIETHNGIAYLNNSGFYHFIQKDKGEIIQLKTGKQKFRKQIWEFVKDCEEMKKHFDFTSVEYRDLYKIISKYNSICPNN